MGQESLLLVCNGSLAQTEGLAPGLINCQISDLSWMINHICWSFE